MKSISAKLVLWLISTTACVLLFLFFMEFRAGQAAIDKEVNNSLGVIADRLASSLQYPVYNFDDEATRSAVFSEFPNTDIAAILVWSEEKKELICGLERKNKDVHPISRAPQGQGLHSIERPLFPPEDVDKGFMDKNVKRLQIGTVQVFLDRSEPEKRLTLALIKAMGKSGLTIVVLLVILVGVVQRFLVRPLESISRAMVATEKASLAPSSDGSAAFIPNSLDPAELTHAFFELKQMGDIFQSMVSAIRTRQAALVESEGRLRRLGTAIAQAEEMIVITDIDGNIEYINPAFEKITGYSDSEALGRNISALLSRGEGDDLFLRELQMILKNGKVWSGRFKGRKKGGAEYDGEATISPVRDEKNAIVNFVAVKRDITQDLILENRVRQAEKANAIGTLAGGIAHDFNNILGAILGYAQLIEININDCRKISDYIQLVQKAGRRAADLVKQILTFSRQAEIEKKPVDLRLIVKETLKFMRASLPATIEIRQNVSTDAGMVLADPTQIHQIIMNLCTNAFHAMKDTGGVLDVRLAPMVISPLESATTEGLEPGNYLKLSVSDTGTGMEPEILKRIFDPYFTTKKVGEGTGLGLAVVQGIVQQHNGLIQVHSQPGKGTAFHVFLPAIADIAESKPEKLIHLPSGNETILFVDDEKDLIQIGVDMLEQLGYHVVAMDNPTQALTKFQNTPAIFDLVITDMTMPKMTGYQLAGEMRKTRPDIPIILCTGAGASDAAERCRAIGIAGLLRKPISLDDLAETVHQVLAESKIKKETS